MVVLGAAYVVTTEGRFAHVYPCIGVVLVRSIVGRYPMDTNALVDVSPASIGVVLCDPLVSIPGIFWRCVMLNGDEICTLVWLVGDILLIRRRRLCVLLVGLFCVCRFFVVF